MEILIIVLFALVLQSVDAVVVQIPEKCNSPMLADYSSCEEISTEKLTKILGMAYNQRYMSISHPTNNTKNLKRNSMAYSDFYVSPNYIRELFPENEEEDHQQSQKRETELGNYTVAKNSPSSQDKVETQWDCNATPKWIDLGEDYFPRYMKIAECGSERCWYGQYYCIQNSFTVVILRKSKKCKSKITSRKNYKRLTQWVWVERALPFMCECVVDK